ncbi:hypothetical protein DFH28DRAFT_826059, partial [Melampsora americana]
QYLKPPLYHFKCHPKNSSSHLTLKGRHFQGDIRLECIQDTKSRITEALLATTFEKMATRTHQMWLDDIAAGYYTVVQQEKDEQGEQD